MGKKKHAEHVNHERWLVSYADLLTLLFAFFVVLFASSVSDKKKTQQMAAAMQTAFTEHGVFEAHAATPPLESGAGNSQGAPAPLMMPTATSPEGAGAGKGGQADLKKVMQQMLSGAVANGTASVRESKDGLTISLREAGLFASGSAEIQPAMMPLLEKIARTLPDRDLRIEGHTDNMPIRTDRFRSNFELSTARADSIADALMTRSRIAPSHFSLAGYGPFRPVASNRTGAGRAQNRRVDIVLLGEGTSAPGTTGPSSTTTTESHSTGGAGPSSAAPLLAAAGNVNSSATQATQQVPLAQQLAIAADRAAAK